MIKDSGNRRDFGGAVRDMAEGKGRCDLMPLDVVYRITGNVFYKHIHEYMNDGYVAHLYGALGEIREEFFADEMTMILEVAKHFEEGCKKYGERNWENGIPEWSFIDSAIRHFSKAMRGDDDERHDRAAAWNVMCLIWTHEHITEGENNERA